MSFYDNTIKDNYQAFNNQRLLFNLLLLQTCKNAHKKNNINNIFMILMFTIIIVHLRWTYGISPYFSIIITIGATDEATHVYRC